MLFLIFTLGFLCMGMQISASLTEMREKTLEALEIHEEKIKKEEIKLIKKIGIQEALRRKVGAAANTFYIIANNKLGIASYHFPNLANAILNAKKKLKKEELGYMTSVTTYTACFEHDVRNKISLLLQWINQVGKYAKERAGYYRIKSVEKDINTLKMALQRAINNLQTIGGEKIILETHKYPYTLPDIDVDSICEQFEECKNKPPKDLKNKLERTMHWIKSAHALAHDNAKIYEIFLDALEQVESEKEKSE